MNINKSYLFKEFINYSLFFKTDEQLIFFKNIITQYYSTIGSTETVVLPRLLPNLTFWRPFKTFMTEATIVIMLAVAVAGLIVVMYILMIKNDKAMSSDEKEKYTTVRFAELFQTVLTCSMVVGIVWRLVSKF
jgi:heme/copper-type cytochrome/quinol oxidase subunit 4